MKKLFKRFVFTIIKNHSVTRNISIGFAKYYRDNGGNDRIVIVDSLVFNEFRTNEYLFNEYLNTLK